MLLNKKMYKMVNVKRYLHIIIGLIIYISLPCYGQAEIMDDYRIYGKEKTRTSSSIKFPDWFKSSFFDLPEDIAEARAAGKRGIIIMFSYERCNTCRALLRTTFNDTNIVARVQKDYDVIGMDIFSDVEVIDQTGKQTIVKDYANQVSASLTPTLLFIGVENKPLVTLVGFYPPEKFSHVLDYIDGNYYTKMKLHQYLSDKRISSNSKNTSILQDNELFHEKDLNLTPKQSAQKAPLLVLFGRPNCNPCQRFHQRVLSDADVRRYFKKFRRVLLDATDDHSLIVTPDGHKTTPKKWYQALGLSYDVATVFFDETGKEVFRLDAELGRFRMANTMEYVLAKGYLEEKQMLHWRKKQAIDKNKQE